MGRGGWYLLWGSGSMVPSGLPSQSTGTDGPALQGILPWAASIGHPARLSLCLRITRHFESPRNRHHPPRRLRPTLRRQRGGFGRRFLFFGAFGSRVRVPPAAIFRDENRRPMGQEAPSGWSQSGGFRSEGSAQRQPRKPRKIKTTSQSRFAGTNLPSHWIDSRNDRPDEGQDQNTDS